MIGTKVSQIWYHKFHLVPGTSVLYRLQVPVSADVCTCKITSITQLFTHLFFISAHLLLARGRGAFLSLCEETV